jgi:alkylation response protein AidB-like acyl-CoA dehydrogenase
VKRTILEPEHLALRQAAIDFLEKFAVPHRAEWEEQGHVGREIWRQSAAQGLLGIEIPEQYGGIGIGDYRFNAMIIEASTRTRSGVALILQNEIVAPYIVHLGTEEQRQRWLPGMATGDVLGAIAMSEPGAGSDLAGIRTSAVRDGSGGTGGGEWVINGSKTFISGGFLADFVIVVARTDPEAGHKGFTLFVVETDRPGFTRGKKLDKIGQRTSDTMELFFSDVRVPDSNRLGEEGRGFYALMRNLPRERLGIAIGGLTGAEHAFDLTMAYARDRHAFGQPIGTFQVNRHALSEMHTKLQVARTYLDQCILGVVDKTLSAEDAAGAKWWITELEWEIVDRCMQMFGGYGYINEYEIAQIWKDARIQRLYGGTTEILKDLNGRKLGF